MAKLETWDFFNRHVQSGISEGQFMAAQYTLIASGPPSLASLASDPAMERVSTGDLNTAVFPIGVCGRFGINQTRQYARIWEVGSERSYWIPGRAVGQIGLGRTLYHGPNLLRIAYAWYEQKKGRGGVGVPSLFGDDAPLMDLINSNRNPHGPLKVPPGYKNMFLNMASDLFQQPFGMLVYFKDSNGETVGAAYLEHCVAPAHSIGADASGTVMQENMQVQFERLVPINIHHSVKLIDLTTSGAITTAAGSFSGRLTGTNL